MSVIDNTKIVISTANLYNLKEVLANTKDKKISIIQFRRLSDISANLTLDKKLFTQFMTSYPNLKEINIMECSLGYNLLNYIIKGIEELAKKKIIIELKFYRVSLTNFDVLMKLKILEQKKKIKNIKFTESSINIHEL